MPEFTNATEEAIFLRGTFLHWYAGAEHAVTFLLVRCGGHPAYAQFATPLPYPWPRRLSLLRRILRNNGPVQAYADALRPAVEDLTIFERYRHIMAHMLMVVRDTSEGFGRVVFDGHDWIDGSLGRVWWDVSLGDLRGAARDIEEISKRIGQCIHRIVTEVPLHPIKEEAMRPLQVAGRKL